MELLQSILLILLFLQLVIADVVLNVGLIVEGKDPAQERAYQKAIQEANQKLIELIPRGRPTVTLKSVTEYIDEEDAFQASTAGSFKFNIYKMIIIVIFLTLFMEK
ncbi:unnamed protein product [Hymenolepis diminuta]|uniref:Cystatin domain-containing protein n=1 Tax=Hymenolepis diminuta TaxID=6216 RepID=A0A0R3SKL3_HYMDI|nr:unnamed protein product [Hymenolepis diminuta]